MSFCSRRAKPSFTKSTGPASRFSVRFTPTVLQPVSSCCTPETPQRFEAMTAADALDEVLYEINLVEDARRV